MRSDKSIVVGILFSLIPFLLNGCAAFPDYQLPAISVPPDLHKFSNKPSAYLDVGTEYKHRKGLAVWDERDSVRRVTEKFPLFSSYTFHEKEKKEKDFRIRMTFYTERSSVDLMAAMASAFTLGLLPTRTNEDIGLFATVYDHNGNELKKYAYSDSVTIWHHLAMVPFACPQIVYTSQDRIRENLIKHLYLQILEDNILSYK